MSSKECCSIKIHPGWVLVSNIRGENRQFGPTLLPLPLPAAAADEGRHRCRDVRADSDPAVAHPQDERGVQDELALSEAVSAGEHHAGGAKNEGRGRGGPDDEASEELLPLDDSRAAHRDLPVRRLD